MTNVLLKVIHAYQSLSLWFWRVQPPFFIYPSSCRFYPTCSDYALEAIKRQGPFKGSLKALWRIIRCNPFSKGGIDHP